jgi:hypothetical protein
VLHRTKTASEGLCSSLLSIPKITSEINYNGKINFNTQIREIALNTHRLKHVVSYNTILLPAADKSANEQLDLITLIFLFFCSFTDKILNS